MKIDQRNGVLSMSQINPSTRSLVRSSILEVLSNKARADSRGPFGCRDIFLQAADILADKEDSGVRRPDRIDNFRQLLMPHITGNFPNFSLPKEIANQMREVLWDLFVLRIISPASSPGEIFNDFGRPAHLTVNGGIFLDLDQLFITAHGADVLRETDKRILVYDPDGYLSPFLGAQPPPDSELMRYLTECVQVFHNNYLVAAVVLLGASSERLIDVAAATLRDALGEPKGTDWYRTRYVKKRDISTRFKAFEGTLMREYGEELKTAGLNEAFQDIIKLNFEAIRHSRNSIAHPRGNVPNFNRVAGMIHNFSLYFDHTNSIIDYLRKNPK